MKKGHKTLGNAIVITACIILIVSMPIIKFYVISRFALFGPATVQSGQLRVRHAWRIGSGHVIAILVLGVCISIILSIAAAILGLASDPIERLVAPFSKDSNVGLVLDWLASVPIAGWTLALSFAPWARAYRGVAGPDLGETFA